MEESRIIVVVNKDSECINVFKILLLFLISGLNLCHVLAESKDILNSIIHWVVKQTSKIVLIWSNIGWIPIKTFAHLENSSRGGIFGPKIFGNFRN